MLSLTGVLLAAFVPTFLRHVHTSKLAEATELLESMHRHAAAYYEAEHALGSTRARHCLPVSAAPFPEAPSAEPVQVDFSSDPAGASTWKALGRHEPAWLRYSYEVSVPVPGCQPRQTRPSITFRAHGDLDGDGTPSLLERTSEVEQDTLVPKGPLRIVARVE